MKRTYVGHSVFGGRIVFSLEEWEQGDLISAAAMRLHCFWADVLGVHEMSDTDATVPEIVNKIREIARTAAMVMAETPREFAVAVCREYLTEIDRLAEAAETKAGWRQPGAAGFLIDDAEMLKRARQAATIQAAQAVVIEQRGVKEK